MNIIKIEKNNMVNGPGLRTVIWCAGCSHKCKGCHNPEAQNPKMGMPFGDWVFDELKEQLDREEISGVTFSGGEATFITNIHDATKIMKWIKTNYSNKTIWVYSGFKYETISDLEMFNYIDVLVDGKYIAELNPGFGKCKWRGSLNQRVINIPETKKKREIVWVKDFNGKFIFENEEHLMPVLA